MSLTREQRLIILIEECGEVIQAATKCLRFGYDRFQTGYGRNDEVLATEIGDLLGIVDHLSLDQDRIAQHRRTKISRAENAHLQFGAKP